jgi:hypothetical protein
MTKSISALTAVKSPVSFTIEKLDGTSERLVKFGEVVKFLNGYFEKDSPYPGKVLEMDCPNLEKLYRSDGYLKEIGQSTVLKDLIDILHVVILIASNELANNPKFNSKNQSQLNLSLIKKCLKKSTLSSGETVNRTNSRMNFLLNFIILIDAINKHENISIIIWESKNHEERSIFKGFLREHSVSGSKETLNKNLQQFLVNCAVFAEKIDGTGNKALFLGPVKSFLLSLKQSLKDAGRTDIDFDLGLHNYSGDLFKKTSTEIAPTPELGPLSLAPPPRFQMIASEQVEKPLDYQAIDQHVWDRIAPTPELGPLSLAPKPNLGKRARKSSTKKDIDHSSHADKIAVAPLALDSAPVIFAPQKQSIIPPLEIQQSPSAKELREELRSKFLMRRSEARSDMTITAQEQQSTSAMFLESSVQGISMGRESGSASDYGLSNNFSIVIPKATRAVTIPEPSSNSKPSEFISLFSSNESAFESASKKAKINIQESPILISERQPSPDLQDPSAMGFIARSQTPK